MSAAVASPSASLPYTLLLFDIEGTTTPISFVKDILFPFVAANLRIYLQKNYHEQQQTRDDVQALRLLAEEDRASGHAAAPLIPSAPADGNEAALHAVFDAVVVNVAWQMSSDRKSTALKQLQGHMWKVTHTHTPLMGHTGTNRTGANPSAAGCLAHVYPWCVLLLRTATLPAS
jgi:enolase-phosphatase E1